MSNSFFHFKQFTINQNKCAMKVGTDGVLLGSWCDVNDCRNILDVGTGTGLIALMAAQRSTAKIHAIEIDPEAYLQAEENINNSPFQSRINVFNKDYRLFHPENIRYDLILSNPPYFTNSLKSNNSQRNVARHNDSLSLEDLLYHSIPLLQPQGRISLILPAESKERLEEILKNTDFHISRLTTIFPTPTSKPRRILVEITSGPKKNLFPDELIIELVRHEYSEEYINLTSGFYLNM